MKNSTVITITTVHGSKSFTIGQFAKNIMGYAVFFSFMLFLGGGIFVYMLSAKVSDYKDIEEKYHRLLATNSNLEMNINKKENELGEIQEKISDIETMIGLEPKEDFEVGNRLDIAELDAQEKLLMLRNIPNGSPLNSNMVTSNFGWRENPTQESKQFHTGLDLRATINTPVYATADGIVEVARKESKIGYGKLLVLDHVLGFKTLYAHLNELGVKAGQFVKKGQLIGYSGNTGISSGPHLHYEVRYIGIALNPKSFVDWNLKDYGRIFEQEKKVGWESLSQGIKWQWTLLKQLSSQKEQRLQASLMSNANYTSTD